MPNEHEADQAESALSEAAQGVPDAVSRTTGDEPVLAGGGRQKVGKASKQRSANGERVRDRLRTENRIIRAVGTVLARDGFWGIKINAVAREAGVDKVLIYRYFGKLDQLVAAYARELDFWPTVDEVGGYDDEAMMKLALSDRCAALISNLLKAVYRRPLTRDIIAWRLAAESDLTRELDQHRIEVTNEVMRRYVRPEEFATYPNLIPTIRLVTNGALYLVVGQRNNAVVAEPELTGALDTEDGWRLLDATVLNLLRGALTGS